MSSSAISCSVSSRGPISSCLNVEFQLLNIGRLQGGPLRFQGFQVHFPVIVTHFVGAVIVKIVIQGALFLFGLFFRGQPFRIRFRPSQAFGLFLFFQLGDEQQ